MIVKHKLKLYNPTESKLAFVKLFKEYSGAGLKAAKFVTDLCPSCNYFDNNGEYYYNQYDSPNTIDTHISFLEAESKFENVYVTNDYVCVSFDMHKNNTERLRKELDTLGADFILDGLSELREQKIRDILS